MSHNLYLSSPTGVSQFNTKISWKEIQEKSIVLIFTLENESLTTILVLKMSYYVTLAQKILDIPPWFPELKELKYC